MEIVMKNLNDLYPYENNPRKNDDAVDAVVSSIKNFGFRVPIVIDADGVIIAGHTRYKAATKLGYNHVPCVVVDDLSDEKIKAFRLADSKVSELAEWDENSLAREIAEIENLLDDGLLESLGFELDRIDMDDFGTDFDLPDGEQSPIRTCTFTLHVDQLELIEYAISLVKDDITETFGNTNANGNGLYEVVRQWSDYRDGR